MFLTPEQTGGPLIFALRDSNRYAALLHTNRETITPDSSSHYVVIQVCEFDIRHLALALRQDLPLSAEQQAGAALQAGAGDTWQEHERLILLACVDGKLFEYLNSGGE